MHTMLTRDNEKENVAMRDLVMSHFEKDQKMDALDDTMNPGTLHREPTALERVCGKGDFEKFEFLKSVFTELKEDFEAPLTALNYNDESLLHKTMATDNTISNEILKLLKTDAQKMSIFNQRRKSDEKNIFDIVNTVGNEQTLKKELKSVLENVKSSKLKWDVFVPYFYWLVHKNDLESIKELFEALKKEKNVVAKFMATRHENKSNVLTMSVTTDDKTEMVEYWLATKVLADGKELRKWMLEKNENDTTALGVMSKKNEAIVFKHVQSVDKKLLRELLLENEAAVLMSHIAVKEDLETVFKFCTKKSHVLDVELMQKMLTRCGWTKSSDGMILRFCGFRYYGLKAYLQKQQETCFFSGTCQL